MGGTERKTLVIGSTAPEPQSPLARAFLVGTSRLKNVFLKWILLPLRAGAKGDGSSGRGKIHFIGDGLSLSGFASRDRRRSGHNESLEKTLEITQQWAGMGDGRPGFPSFNYRGCNLPDICRMATMWTLSRFWKSRVAIEDAVSLLHPDLILVRDPYSPERGIVDALMREGAASASVGTLIPEWAARAERALWRAIRVLYLIRREMGIRFVHAELTAAREDEASPEPDLRPTVLFFSPGMMAARGTLPVLRALAGRRKFRIRVIFSPKLSAEVSQVCTDAGLRMASVRSVRPAFSPGFLMHLFRLGAWRRELRESGLSFCGTPLLDILSANYGEFSDYTAAAVKAWIDFWKPKIREMRPRVVVTGNSRDWRVKVVAALAGEDGGRTVLVQDGFYSYNPAHASMKNDYAVVGGEAVREFMVALGAPPDSIWPVGVPKYDVLFSGRKKSRLEVSRDLDLNPDAPIVVVATSHSVDLREKRAEARALLETANSLRNFQLVFKLHPYEHDGVIEGLVNEFPGLHSVRVVKNCDILDLLAAADVVVTRHSSCGVEAIALNKELVILNLSGTDDPVPYVKDGAATGVYRAQDLLPAFRRLLEAPKGASDVVQARARFVKRYLGDGKGNAAAEAARRIEEELEASRV